MIHLSFVHIYIYYMEIIIFDGVYIWYNHTRAACLWLCQRQRPFVLICTEAFLVPTLERKHKWLLTLHVARHTHNPSQALRLSPFLSLLLSLSIALSLSLSIALSLSLSLSLSLPCSRQEWSALRWASVFWPYFCFKFDWTVSYFGSHALRSVSCSYTPSEGRVTRMYPSVVCVYVYRYACVCIHMYVYRYACVCIRMYVYRYACVCIRVYTCVNNDCSHRSTLLWSYWGSNANAHRHMDVWCKSFLVIRCQPKFCLNFNVVNFSPKLHTFAVNIYIYIYIYAVGIPRATSSVILCFDCTLNYVSGDRCAHLSTWSARNMSWCLGPVIIVVIVVVVLASCSSECISVPRPRVLPPPPMCCLQFTPHNRPQLLS